jgi:peptide/nickel transport system substrate-binding protein
MKWSDGEPATCEDARWTYQLVLDAVASEAGYIGSGYLEPYLTNAGLKAVECTDATTLVATTDFPTTLLTQAYVPILPKHVWEKHSLDEIGNAEAKGFFTNAPPVVGTGPYVAVEWTPGEFIRFERNENYWGVQGAADEVILQTFADSNTMVQALKSGEIDYVRGVGADQFDALASEPDIKTAEGFANGYTYLSFNTRGNTDGYNASTSATADPAFRDAVGFAIDKERLVEATLNGHGVVGTTNIPPYHAKWHVEPAKPRTFDLEEAKRRLDAAGYALDGDGKRLDKEGKPIELRLTWPDSESEMATNGQFIQEWFGELGIGVDAFVTEEGKLLDDLLGPDADGKADWDFYMWGWVGDPDPMSLLSFFRTEEIETTINDCFYSNPRYDQLFEEQQRATDVATRKALIAEMQQIFYDDACYHILYYDSVLHAMRTDRFTGWTNQPPDTGTPIFGYGYPGYMSLVDASAEPSPGPSVDASPGASGSGSAPPATPAPSAVPGATGGEGISAPFLIIGLILIAVLVGGFLLMRRRSPAQEEE